MKKLFVLLLCLVFLLGCFGCSDNQQKSTQGSKTFTVGYGRANVTPDVPVGLDGYGNVSDRVSDNILSYLYLTCLAVTDEQGNTVLLFGIDSTTNDANVTQTLRSCVSRATGVPEGNIMISASHTHSAPEIENPIFQSLIFSGAVKAAEEALADRQEAVLKVGTVKTEGLNFGRHYVQENGNIVGDNFGDKDASPIVGHTVQVDTTMQIMQFEREGKDILLANFAAHPCATGGADLRDISADFVGAFRERMEQELNCNFLYFTGAAGNVNHSSRITEENVVSGYKEHGYKLAEYAVSIMDSLTPVETGDIEVTALDVECVYDYDDGDLFQHVQKVFNAYNAGGSSAANAVGRPLGINSIYHARAINRRQTSKEKQGYSKMVTLNVVAIGDVAFALAPFELFSSTGTQIKEGSPYEMTFVLTLANDHNGYLADQAAFEYGGYEVDHRFFVCGTAENIGQNMVALLESTYQS